MSVFSRFLWNPSIGLHIGTHRIRIVVLDRWFRRIRMVGFGEESFAESEKNLEIKTKTIVRLWERLNICSREVSVHVSGKGVRHFFHLLPEESVQNPELYVKRALSQHLPPGLILSEVVYGYRVLGKTEKGIQVLISYCRPSLVESVKAMVESAGLHPIYMGAGPFDLLTAVMISEPSLLNQTVGILDCEEDIYHLFFVDQGSCTDYQTLFPSNAFDALVSLCDRFEKTAKKPIGWILITGEEGEKFYKTIKNTSFPWAVRFPIPLAKSKKWDARYTFAGGLALHEYYPQIYGINLLSQETQNQNQESRDRKATFRFFLGWGGFIAMLMAILNIGLWGLQRKLEDSQEKLAVMEDRVLNAEMVQRRETQLKKQLEAMQKLFAHRSRVSEILEELSRIMPNSVWLSEIHLGKPSRSSQQENGSSQLQLLGWALREEPLTHFVANLEASPIIHRVQIKEIQHTENEEISKLLHGPIFRFLIVTTLSRSYTLN